MLSNRFEVFRSNTCGMTTQVIENKPFWDWPNELFISPAMGRDNAPTSHIETAVAAFIVGSTPQPAFTRAVYTRPEALAKSLPRIKGGQIHHLDYITDAQRESR